MESGVLFLSHIFMDDKYSHVNTRKKSIAMPITRSSQRTCSHDALAYIYISLYNHMSGINLVGGEFPFTDPNLDVFCNKFHQEKRQRLLCMEAFLRHQM